MASKYTHDVCVSTGTKPDGKGKYWLRIGGGFTESTNGSLSIRLDVMPMPKAQHDGYPAAWLRLFAVDKDRDKASNAPAPPPKPAPAPAPAPQQATFAPPPPLLPVQPTPVPGDVVDDIPF